VSIVMKAAATIKAREIFVMPHPLTSQGERGSGDCWATTHEEGFCHDLQHWHFKVPDPFLAVGFQLPTAAR
jgi:hypothetical protein